MPDSCTLIIPETLTDDISNILRGHGIAFSPEPLAVTSRNLETVLALMGTGIDLAALGLAIYEFLKSIKSKSSVTITLTEGTSVRIDTSQTKGQLELTIKAVSAQIANGND